MEPAGLAVGVVALASLFSTCIEFLEYFECAQSLPEEYKLLTVRLDVQKERLLTWGELVGISKPSKSEGRHEDLDVGKKHDWVERCLSSINKLRNDTERLESEYGVKQSQQHQPTRVNDETLSASRTSIFRKSLSILKLHMTVAKDTGILQKTRWAISDKKKFEKLTSHLTSLIDDLHRVVPVDSREQNRLMFADAALLSIDRLKWVQMASDGHFQPLADAASGMIAASEAGTVGLPSIGGWTHKASAKLQPSRRLQAGEYSPGHHAAPEIPVPYASSSSDLEIDESVKRLYFVYTNRCLLQGTNANCSSLTFGGEIFDENSGISFLPDESSQTQKDSLGSRIIDSMDVKFNPEDVEWLRYSNFELGEIQKHVMSQTLPLATIYIYCAPCVCAFRTARKICETGRGSEVVTFRIRVDDRLHATCCENDSKTKRLESLIHALKTRESTDWAKRNLDRKYMEGDIDRLWLEQRIHTLEEEAFDTTAKGPSGSHASDFFADIHASKSNDTGIVIIGELSTCQWMLHSKPFPWSPRMPKESEIYHLRKRGIKWERTFLGTFTARDYHLQVLTLLYSTTALREKLPSSDLHLHYSQLVSASSSGETEDEADGPSGNPP